MKKKDFSALRKKELSELKKLADEKKKEVMKVKAEIKAGREKNLKVAGSLGKDLAQILTLVREKEILEQMEANTKVQKSKARNNKKSKKTNKK